MSTTFYWATNVACMLSFNHLAISAASNIHSPTFSQGAFLTLRKVQQRATPTALTINVSLSQSPPATSPITDSSAPQISVGDVVVWWRALAVWE